MPTRNEPRLRWTGIEQPRKSDVLAIYTTTHKDRHYQMSIGAKMVGPTKSALQYDLQYFCLLISVSPTVLEHVGMIPWTGNSDIPIVARQEDFLWAESLIFSPMEMLADEFGR